MIALIPRIIYEDEHLLALDKPAGLLTHARGRSSEPTLADWLLARDPSLAAVGEPLTLSTGGIIARPGIVHRLDQGTSGVMVVAKDQPTYWWVREAFRARRLIKSYRLLVHGSVKSSNGAIRTPIGRSRRDPRRRVANEGAAGRLREALTEYSVLRRFERFTYLEAYPRTGRTHQLRAHFKSIQHPIVGDSLYVSALLAPPTINRPALHSYCLEIPDRRQIFLAALPADLFATLAFLRQP